MHKIYFIPNTEPILFLPHFHLFLTYVLPHILSLLAQPQLLHPFGRALLFMSSFSKPAFVQPPPPYKSFRLYPFPPLFTPHSWPTGSGNFNISSLTLLLFPFLSASSPVLVILSASQLHKPAKVYKTLPPSKSCNGTLKSTQDWISVLTLESRQRTKATTQIQQSQRVLLPMENVFEGTKPQSTIVSTKNH